MAKYLEHIAESNEVTTKGVRYEIVNETPREYYVICDSGHEVSYTKFPDGDGDSFANWFKLVEEAVDLTNITVIKDGSIGGIEREYTEVKRKAALGERIKIVKSGVRAWGYVNGDVLTVTRDRGHSPSSDTIMAEGISVGIFTYEYVVLEPTDIMRIGGERLRLVERKANVGERVVITKQNAEFPDEPYKIGDVVTVNHASIRSHHINGTQEHGFGISPGHYAVIEPLKSAHQLTDTAAEDVSLLVLSRKINEQATKLSAQAIQIDGLTDAVAKLTLQLKVAREDIVLIEEGVTADIDRLERNAGVGQYAKATKLPLTRDEIIAKAKRDVAELGRTGRIVNTGGRAGFWPYGGNGPYIPMDDVSFVVNRDKRTVAALITYRDTKRVWTRGIAKCAPGECFNVHIGRAIALRRALGLEVPAEYTDAPAPSEPRVGDIVIDNDGMFAGTRGVVTAVRPERYIAAERGLTYKSDSRPDNWTFIEYVVIIDDSRENGAEGEVAQ